jgi:hypothetical protein
MSERPVLPSRMKTLLIKIFKIDFLASKKLGILEPNFHIHFTPERCTIKQAVRNISGAVCENPASPGKP